MKFIATERRTVVARGRGKRSGELVSTEFQFGTMKRTLWLDGGDGCTAM